MKHIWLAFLQLHDTRSYAFTDVRVKKKQWRPMGITNVEIQAYMQNMDLPLKPWEVNLILRLDRVFRSNAMKFGDVPDGKNTVSTKSGAAVNSFMQGLMSKLKVKRDDGSGQSGGSSQVLGDRGSGEGS